MSRNRRLCVLVGLLLMLSLSLLAAPAALAGGWATVTLDSLPQEIVAGETLRLGFMVRQHGVTPINALGSATLRPYLAARNEETGEALRVEARQDGPVGHFVVEVAFPSSGTWNWKIVPEPFPAFPEAFEPLTVRPAGSVLDSGSMPPLWPAALAVIALLGLALALRRPIIRRRWVIGAAALVMLGVALALTLTPSVTSGSSQSADAAYGRALFVAKGCAACHVHAEVSHSVPGPLVGPDLTHYQGQATFLRAWLSDPKAIRPDTPMPQLDLSEPEIDALIAFLAAPAGK